MMMANGSISLSAGLKLAGRYELLRELGRGGMGIVHEARDTVLERIVAAKILRSLRGNAAARLRREVRIVAEMDHPGIVPVYDFGYEADIPFFVMPIVRGATLRARLAAGPISERLALVIGAQAADALEYSHVRRVVHRDIKPENIMVLADEMERVRVKVMDFGIAIRTGPESDEVELCGTPAYLAPEQILCEPSDARTDVYSLGVVLYECLAGEPPFAAATVTEMLYRAVSEEPVPLSERAPGIDEAVCEVVMMCLKKRPQDRPRSAQKVADALREAALRAPRSSAASASSEPFFSLCGAALVDDLPSAVSSRRSTRHQLPARDQDETMASGRTGGDTPSANTLSAADAAPAPPRAGRSPEAAPVGDSTAERLGDLLLMHGDYAGAESAFCAGRAARKLQHGAPRPVDDAWHALRLVNVKHKRGSYEAAIQTALAAIEQLGGREPLLAAELFAAGALACCTAGRYEEAESLVLRGFACLRDEAGQTHESLDRAALRAVQARLLRSLGNLRLGQGEPAAAAAVYEEGLAHCDPAADAWERSIALFNLGDALVRAGAYEEAEEYLDRAYTAKAALGDRWGLSYTHAVRARIALDRGALARAARELSAGLDLAQAIGDPKLSSMLHAMRGSHHVAEGRLDEAEQSFELAREEASACLATPEMVQALAGLAEIHLRREDIGRAAALATSAVESGGAGGGRIERGAALLVLGRVEASRGNTERAAQCYAEALKIMDAAQNPKRRAEVRAALEQLRAESAAEG